MSSIEKQIKRLKSKPKDFTYNELKSLLNKLGFMRIIRAKLQVQELNLETS